MQAIQRQTVGEIAAGPVAAARALAAGIRDRAEHIERHRRLPAELVRAMAGVGLFRMCVPRVVGGLEVDAATMVEAIEEVAKADGSAGWCVMIGATSGLVSAYLPEAVAQRNLRHAPQAITGGVFAPHGKAMRRRRRLPRHRPLAVRQRLRALRLADGRLRRPR